jgi:thiosulfate/3-mercaptopyruvate sulfurtransferase
MTRAITSLALGLCFTAASAPAPTVRSSMVVTVEWVAQHLNDPNLVLLHVGQKDDFDAAHLPGAQFLPREAFGVRDVEMNLTLQLPPVATLVERLEALGVSNTSRVVLYFGTDWVTPTARAWLTFDYLGLGDRASILDGGLPAWKNAGRPVTTEVRDPRRGHLTPDVRPDVVADLAYVRAHLSSKEVTIVDCRLPRFYSGEDAGSMPRGGHVPGARNVPFDSLVRDDNRLKDVETLRQIMNAAGVGSGQRVVTYCHIGQQASLGYFVAKYLGYPVRLYDGSFEEWSRHTDLPVETGTRR